MTEIRINRGVDLEVAVATTVPWGLTEVVTWRRDEPNFVFSVVVVNKRLVGVIRCEREPALFLVEGVRIINQILDPTPGGPGSCL